MPRSDWCEQHTTLYANIEFFFYEKKKLKIDFIPDEEIPALLAVSKAFKRCVGYGHSQV